MDHCKVLLIEDDREIARLTKMYLEAEGYEVLAIEDGAIAVETVKDYNPDVVLLDLMLPGKDGATICREVREFYQGMIMAVTASEDEMSEVSLFKFGVDDYVTKPVRGHILVARIEALLRRYKRSAKVSNPNVIEHYGVELCTQRQQVFFNQKPIVLTDSEYDILHILMKSVDTPVSRATCCESSRGIEYNAKDRSIDMRVSGLRKKLTHANVTTAVIKTIRNQGYMLTGT